MNGNSVFFLMRRDYVVYYDLGELWHKTSHFSFPEQCLK